MFITDLANFTNFHLSLITLFRASTGEDWQALMSDLWQDESKSCVSETENRTCAKYRKIFLNYFDFQSSWCDRRILHFLRHPYDFRDAEPFHAGSCPVVRS